MAHCDGIAALNQLEFLEDTLRRTSLRFDAIQNALLDARLAFEQAKRTLDAFTAEAESLDASMARLKSDICARRHDIERAAQDAQASRVRRILAGFPSELLCCIFLQAMQAIEEIWSDEDQREQSFSHAHATLPFTLASVCRLWRAVALHTAGIWTFVGIGRLDDQTDLVVVDHVQLLLSRSKRCPLDVFLGWPDCTWSRTGQYADIVAAVARHAHRWRRVTITFPEGTPDSALDMFRLPTPALEWLTLRCVDDNMLSTTTPPTYLPFCPLLRCLFYGNSFAVPQNPLANLTSFQALVDRSSSDEVWAVLQMLPSVQRLSIDFLVKKDDNLVPGLSSGPLRLAHLLRLKITGWSERFSAWLDLLEIPVLQELVIEAVTIEAHASLFDKAADSLRTLTLYAAAAGAAFPATDIAKLGKLRRLVLLDCSMGREYCMALASRETVGLPLLESIAVKDPRLDEEGAAHVSSLMHRLNAHAASGAQDAIAFELSLGNGGDVPEWLLRQYKFITGASDEEDEGVV